MSVTCKRQRKGRGRMVKKKQVLLFVSLFVFVLLSVGYIWRYQTLNAKYPNPKIEQYSYADTVKVNGFEVNVQDKRCVTASELQKEFGIGNTNQVSQKERGEIKYWLVTLKIKNVEKKKQRFQYTNISVQYENSASVYDLNTIYNVNSNDIVSEFKPSEETIITLPFQFDSIYFSEDTWNIFDQLPIRIALSIYPIKRVVV